MAIHSQLKIIYFHEIYSSFIPDYIQFKKTICYFTFSQIFFLSQSTSTPFRLTKCFIHQVLSQTCFSYCAEQ